MLKNRRERILAGVLAVAGVSCLAGEALCNAVLHPFGVQEKQLASLTRKVGDQRLIFQRVEHAQRRLRHDLQSSLPPDPSVAGTLYQNWLVELARSHGLTDAVITPHPPQPEKQMGYRLTFSVQTSSSPSQIGGFIDSLQRAPLLHRITQLELSNAVTGSGKESHHSSSRLKSVVNIEALALSAAEPRQQLFSEADDLADLKDEKHDYEEDADEALEADDEEFDESVAIDGATDDDDERVLAEVRQRRLTAAQSLSERLATQQGQRPPTPSADRSPSAKPLGRASQTRFSSSGGPLDASDFVSMQRLLASARLFERYEPPPPRPTKSVKDVAVTTPPDPLTQLQLVATWDSGPTNEAWVFDASQRQKIVLRVGSDVRLLNMSGKVMAIQNDRVTLLVNNEQRDWLLGQNLKMLAQPISKQP